MTPYAAAGTFVSRVFDAIEAVDWGGLTWTGETPAATTLAFFARHGETPSPDASWSAFAPVAQPGDAIGGRSRYLQYRVDLATPDPSLTPAIGSVTVGYAMVPPNHAPAAAADAYGTPQNTPLTIPAPGVLANDSDPDADLLTAVVVTPPAHGTLALSATGGFTYTPSAGYAGPDSFVYKASDSRLESDPATVTLTVAPASHTPVGQSDSYAAVEDTLLTVGIPGVLANDTDPDGRVLAAVLVSGPSHGQLTKFAANGSFKYKPAADYSGPDSFVYRAVAGGVASAETTVTIEVAPVDDAPVAGNDIYRNDQQQTLNVAGPGVLANDTDVDSTALTAVLVTKPVHGKLTLRADGSFTYTSNSTFDGTDSFTYKASDGAKKSAVATVTITGHSTHPGFVAQPDAYVVDAGTTLAVAAPGVLANDHDPSGASLVTVLSTTTAHGTLALAADGSFTYAPDAGFVGTDSFIYRALCSDGDYTPPTIVTIVVR
jgi:VCBS repeat-containing protein